VDVDPAELAAAEALTDPRIGAVSSDALAAELALHFPEAELDPDTVGPLDSDILGSARRARPIEWAARSLTQGAVLDAFAAHCRDELDDVDLLSQGPVRLELVWRRERAAIELRCGFLFLERLAEDEPLLLLGELTPAAVERFLADEALRGRVAVYDLAQLEKVNAVRASAFVYFEWFLRDVYRVKVAPAAAFTQGLVERGIISLGMG
jgi:hypothetical protein